MKKSYLFFIWFLMASVLTVKGQSNAPVANPVIAAQDSEPVFQVVEEMPLFPGGESEMAKYIAKNIIYPASEAEAGIQGTVYTSFVVASSGKVMNVKVVKGIPDGAALDAEAVRVIRSFPDFKPGKQNGRAVSVQYVLPIRFNLHKNEQKKK
jgi:protein TonB